jgi:uncharacterized protein
MGPLDQRLPAEDSYVVLSQRLKQASDDWYIGKSDIAGQGVFAGKDYDPGDSIGLAMTDGDEDEFGAKIWNLTELARYCNHQNANNVEIRKNEDGDRFQLVAIEPIGQDEEIVSNYWQVAKAKGPHSTMLWEGKPVPTSDLQDYTEKGASAMIWLFTDEELEKQAGKTIKDLDISEYLKGYELNDAAHGPDHAENVRSTAAGLSGVHAPGQEHLVDYAAALHDMDVHRGRVDHENRAADTIANSSYFQKNLSKRDLRTVSEAVRQHRSSTGRPRTTVAKIVSDADRLAETDPAAALRRAISWGKQHEPASTEDEQIRRAYDHLVEKYGPGGKARRLYYPESLPQMEAKFNPLMDAGGDLQKIKALLQEKQARADLQKMPLQTRRSCGSITTIPKVHVMRATSPMPK